MLEDVTVQAELLLRDVVAVQHRQRIAAVAVLDPDLVLEGAFRRVAEGALLHVNEVPLRTVAPAVETEGGGEACGAANTGGFPGGGGGAGIAVDPGFGGVVLVKSKATKSGRSAVHIEQGTTPREACEGGSKFIRARCPGSLLRQEFGMHSRDCSGKDCQNQWLHVPSNKSGTLDDGLHDTHKQTRSD